MSVDRSQTYEYAVRVSPRARNINLRITPDEGLTIIVPRRCGPADIQSVITQKKAWIERSLAWAEEQRRLQASLPPVVVPSLIDLPGLRETWAVELNPTAAKSTRVNEASCRRLRLSGSVYDTKAATNALKRWLSRRARQVLPPRLELLGERHGFPAVNVNIRNQRSCWASCSPRGTVSLNLKLMFLTPPLVDYVLLHELCHTVHLNHSRRFWKLVERVEPDFKERRCELTAAWDCVPRWVA